MNLLFVNSIQMFAGGEVWMIRALQRFRERGHKVMLACRPDSELAVRAARAEIRVFGIEFRGDFDPFTILRLRRVMAQNAIDVVLTNMDKELRLAGLAAKLVRPSPVVIPRRGIDYPLKDRFRYRFTYNTLASRIVANSEATKASLLRNAPWLDPSRIEVVYNGIDPTPFQTADGTAVRTSWQAGESDVVLGFVGQLDERKGIGVLLSAYERVHQEAPGTKLVFVGIGPLSEMIESEARSKGWERTVQLCGFRDDIPEVMQAIDVLVLPSYWEGFGIVLIEAMAAGTPVVTANVSSMPEIVEDGISGYLVEAGDSETLAGRLLELVQDPELRREMGAKGMERVDRVFSHTHMINHLEALFSSELAKRNSQGSK